MPKGIPKNKELPTPSLVNNLGEGETNVPAQTVPRETETVTLPKEKFEEIMARVQRLEYSANKAQLAKFDIAHKDKSVRKMLVTSYEGRIVKAWKMMMDLVEKHPLTGVWHEEQVVRVYLEDDSQLDMPYVQFTRRGDKKICSILGESKDEEGNVTYKLQLDEDGKIIEIDKKFVN